MCVCLNLIFSFISDSVDLLAWSRGRWEGDWKNECWIWDLQKTVLKAPFYFNPLFQYQESCSPAKSNCKNLTVKCSYGRWEDYIEDAFMCARINGKHVPGQYFTWRSLVQIQWQLWLNQKIAVLQMLDPRERNGQTVHHKNHIRQTQCLIFSVL